MTNTKMTLAVLTFGILAGCGTDTDPINTENESCTGGKCDSSGFEVFKGGIWTACEITPGETEDIVTCSLFGDGEVLAPVGVTVQATDSNGVGVAGGIFRADPTQGRDFPAAIRHESYPVDLAVAVDFDRDNNIKGFDSSRLTTQIKLESASSFPEQLIIEQPFDIWRVQMAALDTLAIFETSAPTESNFVDSEGKPHPLTLRPALIAQGEEIADELIAVPLGSPSIEGRLRAGQSLTETTVSITGPGRYVADETGLRKAGDSHSELFGSSQEPSEPIIEPEPEPGCDLDYTIWINDFAPLVGKPEAQEKLDGLTCTPIDPAAFSMWHALFIETVDAGVPNSNSTLDEREIQAIEQVLAAKPGSDDAQSYLLALNAYNTRLDQYVPNANSNISNDERVVLDLLVASHPESAPSDETYAAWLAIYQPWFDKFVPNASSILSTSELDVLGHIFQLLPKAAGTSAYDGWFNIYEKFFDLFVPNSQSVISAEENVVLVEILKSQPASTTTPAFVRWATRFTTKFNETGSTVTTDEQNVLDQLVEPKPCVSDVAGTQTTLDELASDVSENLELYVEMTKIEQCE